MIAWMTSLALAAPCQSTCSSPAPGAQIPLDPSSVEALLDEVSQAPVGAITEAVEALLFHGEQARSWLDQRGDGPLDDAHAAWLRRELARRSATISFRLLDDDGTVRGAATASVPLGRKQHVALQRTGSLGDIDVAGRVHRVGLHHLWTRW